MLAICGSFKGLAKTHSMKVLSEKLNIIIMYILDSKHIQSALKNRELAGFKTATQHESKTSLQGDEKVVWI